MTTAAIRHAIGAAGAVSPIPVDAWNEVFASAPDALPTQARPWLRCVCAVDGYEDASRLYRAPDGRRLVLPLVRGRALGPVLSARAALPAGWGPGGLLGEGGVTRPDDIAMVVADLASLGAFTIRLRPDPSAARAWEDGMPAGVVREPAMAQTLSLEGGFDTVWRTRFRRDARNRVRRAERAEVTVERDDGDRLVPVFHRLYAMSVLRWARRDGDPRALARWRAARREPDRKLRTVASAADTGCRLYAAFRHGRPLAAIVVLFAPGVAAYWRGAMDEDLAGPVHANYLLHRVAIEDAAAAGCGAYHMGDSAPGSSLALFKSRFGAVEQHYSVYRIERAPLTRLRGTARGTVQILRTMSLRGR
jgi:Acetyltransferase (GNAT) domain